MGGVGRTPADSQKKNPAAALANPGQKADHFINHAPVKPFDNRLGVV
jgi:hypothetical protein